MPLFRQGFRRRQDYGGQVVGQAPLRPAWRDHGAEEAGFGDPALQFASAKSAFSLLEVIVALAIFALAAVVLGSAYLNVLTAYETVSRGNQTDEDVRFARSLLLAEPDHDTAEKGGDFVSPGGRQVRWHATITSTTTADLFTVAFVCDLADPASNGGTQTVTENFTVMRPTWADPAENTKLKQDAQDRIAKLQGKTNSTQQ